jgi:hypothetical protein
MQITIELCTCVSISALQTAIKKVVTKDYPDSTEQENYDHTLAELKKFTINDQYFDYVAIKNYMGGYRWFFVCPKCKKRAGKLFLPPYGTSLRKNAKHREHLFLCKDCHKLKNQSAIANQSKIYKNVTKPLKRLKFIEDRIAKGHIRPDGIKELLDEHESIEKGLKESQEFRLYSFKKKHNL